MGIMGCYPDKRAIENELGGKWEKVETLNITDGEIIVYDEDIDGTPLNINGIMFVYNINGSYSVTIKNKAGDNIVVSLSVSSAIERYGVIKFVDRNGLLEPMITRRATTFASIGTPVCPPILYTVPFEHDYNYTAWVGTGSGTIDVYFLRGV